MPAETLKHVYIAGAALKDGRLVTGGGRVLGVTAVADSLENAIAEAYALGDTITFENKYFRHDIGQRALQALRRS